MRTVSLAPILVLAHETGAPMDVLDRTGNEIGTLPGLPADPATFGDAAARPVACGRVTEALFWIRPLESQVPPRALGPEPRDQDLAAARCRRGATDLGVTLAADAGCPHRMGPGAPDQDGPSTGIVYRPPTPAGE